nr:hypothetical protein Itr_chr10CG13170 [Ipomoea trifida]GMC71711.1 hypothetical protein Iba_chr03bCG5110 [Ipomoea batatas]
MLISHFHMYYFWILMIYIFFLEKRISLRNCRALDIDCPCCTLISFIFVIIVSLLNQKSVYFVFSQEIRMKMMKG